MRQALVLLRSLTSEGSLTLVQDVILFEAKLTGRQVQSLCAWESGCEDCEDTFDLEEDRTAPWIEESPRKAG